MDMAAATAGTAQKKTIRQLLKTWIMRRVISCTEAKQIDLADYLSRLGHQPQKIRNNDYWYLSPFREENTASFKVNRRRNIWYDHGTGKGGDLIDFGKLYFNCSTSELLQRLSENISQLFSFHQPFHPSVASEKKDSSESKIVIVDSHPLQAKSLLSYLQKRNIPPAIAQQFCREIDFLLYGKKYTAAGFKNNSGGYELRSENFKGSSTPKDITFIDNDAAQAAVFEGFINYLSFLSLSPKYIERLTNLHGQSLNFLVLNSLSFFERSRQVMEQHQHIHLFLDRDNAGTKWTTRALEWDKLKYTDRSALYKDHKDLNEWLVHYHQQQKEQLKTGRKL